MARFAGMPAIRFAELLLLGDTFVMSNREAERLMGGIPHLSLEELISHPRLTEAREAYIDAFLSVYEGDTQVARLLIESARFLVFQIMIVLHASQEAAKPETWPTVGGLKRALQNYGMPSARQVDLMLSRLRDVGFVEITPSEQDGRLRLLRPTEAALAHDREWLLAHYTPLAFLYPARDYSGAMTRDPLFQSLHRRVGISFVPFSATLLMQLPELMVFFNHAGGAMFQAAILQAAMQSPDGTHAAVSYADVGERFGYSRTHVRRVLQDAEAAGLVRLHHRGGHRVEILPSLWAGYDRGMAVGMYLNDMMYAKAMGRSPTSH
jgi:hypothetical protein